MLKYISVIIAFILLPVSAFAVLPNITPVFGTEFNYTEGQNLVPSVFTSASNAAVTAEKDPTDPSNICAMIQLEASNDRDAYAQINMPQAYTGRVEVSMRVYINSYDYRQMPLIRKTSGEMFVFHTASGGVQAGNDPQEARAELNKWTNYRHVFDTDAKTYEVYINDSAVPSLFGTLSDNSNVNQIVFMIYKNRPHALIYVDDIAVRLGITGFPQDIYEAGRTGSFSYQLENTDFKGSFTLETRLLLNEGGTYLLELKNESLYFCVFLLALFRIRFAFQIFKGIFWENTIYMRRMAGSLIYGLRLTRIMPV